MTDMDAFDRLVAKEVMHATAPPRPVDDAAIFTAITTTRSPKWRFQSMFSATKLVVAGAIVALFGGFLLAGTLTQPSQESAPAAVTDSPDPSAGLLPGVDLVTEEVEPGVHRVVSDGERDLSAQVHDVTVTPEGDVWLEIGPERDWWSLVRLGEPDVSRRFREDPWELGLTSDGIPAVSTWQGSTRVFDGTGWPWSVLSTYDECVLASRNGAVAADGSCWVGGDGNTLLRIEPDGSSVRVTGAELGLEPEQGQFGSPMIAPDGIVWTNVGRSAPGGAGFDGLLAYDGTAWSFIPYDGDLVPAWNFGLSIGLDGVVWHGRTLSASAGTDPSSLGRPFSFLSWDGGAWTDHGAGLEAPMLSLFGSSASAYAPDGSVWAVIDGQLYVVTPEAVAAAETVAAKPTEQAAPVDISTTAELLPGVDLVTEGVEPGVERIVSDGIRDLSGIGPLVAQSHAEKDGLAVAPDGAVWLHPGGDENKTLIKLGDPGSFPALSEVWPELRFSADGVLWGHDHHAIHRLGAAGWSEMASMPGGRWDVGADGAVWSVLDGTNVVRLDASGMQDYPIDLDQIDDELRQLMEDYGEDPDAAGRRPYLEDLRVDTNGDVWAALVVTDEGVQPMVLLRYDGETWSLVDPHGLGGYRSVGLLDIGTDGTLWVYLEAGRDAGSEPDRHYLARLADDRWTAFSDEDGVVDLWDRGDAPGLLRVDHEGTVWMQPQGDGGYRGVRVFDGKTWRHYLDDHDVIEMEIAPDGRVWVLTSADLFVITPEAVAAAE